MLPHVTVLPRWIMHYTQALLYHDEARWLIILDKAS